ncbi:MAG: hypothetical protein KatS3mg124_2399 [Porticoccaceae bacterium]|nr:MAG: hypothetical protein KatS3mg124_2399 [Porticoccaceae bacterium]
MSAPAKIARATVYPRNTLNLLSREEIVALADAEGPLQRLFRDCALAILNVDTQEDDASRILDRYRDFAVRVLPQERGVKLEIENAPAQAFVDGKIIRGIQEHLFAALRDILYLDYLKRLRAGNGPADPASEVFEILRNARALRPDRPVGMVICWGGHSVPREEYDFSKQVGYELGLRGLDIATGCGIGAMKGPMKGAAIGHAKQQIRDGRYLGLSEPGIIASEPPNAIVNELVILPDIEKRLEAFVRLAHAIVVFPGGVGTLEELLYLFAVLMHPDNRQQLPLVLAGPESTRDYFARVERFLVATLGEGVRRHYSLVVGDAAEVARRLEAGVEQVFAQRRARGEAYYFNWSLSVPAELQTPFDPTHENMAALCLDPHLPPHRLAAELRRAFSGIVAGNVKAVGIERVRRHGPFLLRGDARLMAAMDELLTALAAEGRMRLGRRYRPCYRIEPLEVRSRGA